MEFHYRVRGIIIVDGKVLLAHQIEASNTFLPGGHIESGEGAQAALVRELYEETGYIAGERCAFDVSVPDTWGAFAATGHKPCPHRMTPVARAITPPGRVRRFDTWFFTIDRSALADQAGSGDGELLHLDWFGLDAARALDLPNITRLVLDDITEKLCSQQSLPRTEIPFYFHDGCVFQRTLMFN